MPMTYEHVGDITTIPMSRMIITRHMRQVYNRCKILIQYSVWCHKFVVALRIS